MKFSAAAVVALVAGASAAHNVTYTTEVVTAYTTYCPVPTTITYGASTYTVTEVSQTKTISTKSPAWTRQECMGDSKRV